MDWGKAWYVLTTPPKAMAADAGHSLWGGVLNIVANGLVPIAEVAALVLLLLIMMGSKRCVKWFTWTISLTILVKLVSTCV